VAEDTDKTRPSTPTPARFPFTAEPPPDRVGRYVVEGEIGRGGMGIVYRARDSRLDRIVALKALPHAVDAGQEARERFEREARMLAALEHPHVAAIHGIEDAGGRSYLVLQHVAGETLASRLRRGPLPLREACEVGRQIAAGLAAAHRRSIVHCDLKPGNVMVTAEGSVKLLDFGIATRWRPDPEARRDAEPDRAESIGTPAYMSPEQVRGEPLDPRTDVWSFGCVLLECLTGGRAFDGADTAAKLRAVLVREPDLGVLGDEVPSRLRRLLERCLTKDRDARFDDIAEVGRELEQVASGTTGAAATSPEALPRALTTFIGREREVEEIASLLETSRLLTLTGAAGCGKTRLAMECASRFAARRAESRTWLVPLAPLGDPENVVAAIAAVVDARQERGRALEDTIVSALGQREGLLILDNCEHLLAECARLVGRVLSSSSGVTVLCTSREALGVAGETPWRVRSLEHPPSRRLPPLAELESFDGIRLFVTRAREVQPSFALDASNAAAIAAIVERLDGIPLALELAAARLRMLSPQQVLDRLSDRFRLLTGGSRTALERHQTLRAALDWSHDLLAADEQRCLRELSVFAGGYRLEEATKVCTGDEFEVLDLLTHLVDKSLVQVEPDARRAPRYRLLESVRQHASVKLHEAGEADVVRERHHDCFAALVQELATDPRRDVSGWMSVLAAEHENVRVALEWCLTCGDPSELFHLIEPLADYWEHRGHSAEAKAWIERALARPGAPTEGKPWASVVHALGIAKWWLGDIEGALAEGRRAQAAALGAGDMRVAANAELLCATSLHVLGRLAEARDVYVETLRRARESGHWSAASTALGNLGIVSRDLGDLEAARRHAEEALALSEERGWTAKAGRALRELGIGARDRGDLDEARRLVLRALALHEEHAHARDAASARVELGNIERMAGNIDDARRLFERSVREYREMADARGVAVALGSLGGALRDAGALDEAWQALSESLAILLPSNATAFIATITEQIAWVRVAQGRSTEAARLVGAVIAAREAIGRRPVGLEKADRERRIDELRAAMGPDEFDAEAAHGATLGLVALAEDLVSERR